MNRRLTIVLFLMALMGLMGWAYAFAADSEKGVTVWKQWKSIDAAIALRPLDGPEDIIEKAEIIEDRVDAFAKESRRIDQEIEGTAGTLQTLRLQREVLMDLSEIKFGPDAQTRQRLHDLIQRIQIHESRLKKLKQSNAELQKEHIRWKTMAIQYREKARQLRLKEGGGQ